MITHDRYFLDNVSNKTIELDHGDLFSYDGNYTLFVEKKIERQQMAESMERKRQNLYRQELAWIKRGAKARSTSKRLEYSVSNPCKKKVTFDRMAKWKFQWLTPAWVKKSLSFKTYVNHLMIKKIIDDFSYTLLPDDRIGIVGKNGAGKSTLLNLITGKLKPDSGSIDIGSTVKIGYFSQESEALDESMRAIEFIREFGENVTTSDGTKITAGQMMERFLFDKDLQWTYINRLSGGEKRRLYLLSILMQAPNILILDEPTNDLDIDTLKVLEMYLDEFRGAVISVSHDRYFLDRTCQRIFAFTGGGHVQEHTGNYSDYAAYKKEMEDETNKQAPAMDKSKVSRPEEDSTSHKKVKFSYNEQREFAMIEEEIESLESKLSKIDAEMATVSTDFVRLGELTTQKDEIEEALLEKMERFEYLSDLNDQIMAQKKK